MGIATATGEPELEAVLEKFGMLGYFSAIYSTYTVGAAKTELVQKAEQDYKGHYINLLSEENRN